MDKEILKEVKQIAHSYKQPIDIMGHSVDQYDILRTIEYYSNSWYTESQEMKVGNSAIDKPFYNIVNAKVNVGVRATDFDTKDIQVVSDNETGYVRSFLLGKEIKNWMKESKFAKFLNEITETRVRYGGVLVKKNIEDGELVLSSPEWKNVTFNPKDIMSGAIIELHHLEPDEVFDKRYVWDNLNEHLSDVMALAVNKNERGEEIYSTIPVYEIHATLPMDLMEETDTEDYADYVIYIAGELDGKSYLLHWDAEPDGKPYKYLPWREVPGRSLGVGMVEDGIEAQVWTNDSIIMEKLAMTLGSKMIYKSDDNTLENNMFTDADVGHIIKLSEGRDLQQIDTQPRTLQEFQNIMERWENQYQQTTSTFEAVTGETMPSGTPFRSLAIQNQEGQSHFKFRQEEMGIFIEELFNDWIIPHLAKKINREHILRSELSANELKMVDDAFTTYRANDSIVEKILSGKIVTQEDYDAELEYFQDFISQTKDHRYFEVPKGYFKDSDMKVDIITTGEKVNKAVLFETINNLLGTIASSYNPQTGQFTMLEDPVMSQMIGKALEYSGIGMSPAELGIGKSKKEPSQLQINQPENVQVAPQQNAEPVLQ